MSEKSLIKKIKWPFLLGRYSLFHRFDRNGFIKSACKDCIRHGDGCCVYPFYFGWKIVLLPHEIKRISEYTGKAPDSFVDHSPLVPSQLEYYREDGNDPAWSRLFNLWERPTGLKNSCPFLTPAGCTLPYNTKPFLCQVYPLTFNISRAAVYQIEDPDCLLIQASSCADDVLKYFKDNDVSLGQRFEEYRADLENLSALLERNTSG
jgi:Fe-S-cluster containining protein